MIKYVSTVIIIVLITLVHYSTGKTGEIRVPDGFEIEVYVSGINTARSMTFGVNKIMYVGSWSGSVYRIGSDKKPDVIISGLDQPVGVDYYNGDLYISEVSKIYRIKAVEDRFKNNSVQYLNNYLEIVSDKFPHDRAHGWKFIKVGPDNKLYVPVGAPCNVCLKSDERYASIMRMDLDGSNLEIFAHGIRNTVGFDWHPETKELWFTDNGRDRMGDDIPPDELNRASYSGLHFGFPYLHGKSVKDPEFWNHGENMTFQLPEHEFSAHVAVLGMRFYVGNLFPPYYKHGIFVAEHGSWNRSNKIGYRVSFIKLNNEKVEKYEIFAYGWLQSETIIGRPADVEIGPDGSLYISDDYAHKIYRVSYKSK